MAVFEDIWGFHTWSRDAKGPWKGQDTAECPAKTGPPYHKALFGPKRQQCEVEKPWSRPSGAAREDPRVSVLHGCFLLPLVLSLTGGVRGRGWGPPSAPQLPLVLPEARRPPPLRRWSSRAQQATGKVLGQHLPSEKRVQGRDPLQPGSKTLGF